MKEHHGVAVHHAPLCEIEIICSMIQQKISVEQQIFFLVHHATGNKGETIKLKHALTKKIVLEKNFNNSLSIPSIFVFVFTSVLTKLKAWMTG